MPGLEGSPKGPGSFLLLVSHFFSFPPEQAWFLGCGKHLAKEAEATNNYVKKRLFDHWPYTPDEMLQQPDQTQ